MCTQQGHSLDEWNCYAPCCVRGIVLSHAPAALPLPTIPRGGDSVSVVL